MTFSEGDKRTLLSLAGEAIRERIDPKLKTTFSSDGLTEALKSRCGAFVSLYVDQHLRGCIGTFSEEPLYKNVTKMAASAATDDSRFVSIQEEELYRLNIEISILTPRKRVYDPSEIVVGKHGIYIKQGSFRGTLLPQVAVNQNWTVKEFLENCSRNKAGIGRDGWKTAELYTYEAIVFQSDSPVCNC